ncbi:MAG: glyoxalase [Marmoricola sp.]|nr:glyoxalase [Marmoricola sp.]
MVFWQLTINAIDPAGLADFWEQELGWSRVPTSEPDTTRWRHYRRRLGDDERFDERLFDPEGLGPCLWFQYTEEPGTDLNRLHLDLFVTGRDDPFFYVVMRDPEGNELCLV